MFDCAPSFFILGLPFAGVTAQPFTFGPGVLVSATLASVLGIALAASMSRHLRPRRPGSTRKGHGAVHPQPTPVHAFARHGPESHALTGFLAGGAWARPGRALVAALDELGRYYLSNSPQEKRRLATPNSMEPDPTLVERLAKMPSRVPRLRWTGDDVEDRTVMPPSESAGVPNAVRPTAPALRFVGTLEASDRPAADARPIHRFERVVLGDVPGMPGVWLTQYAQQRADADPAPGPLALLKVHAEGIDVEVISPRSADVTPEDRAAGFRNGSADRDAAALLHRLMNRRHQPVGTVLLHVDEDMDIPSGCNLPSDFTVIASADETEISDALAALGLALSTRDEPDPVGGDSVALALVGSPEADCRQIYQRAAADIADRTGVEVRLGGICSQVQPVRSNALGTFSATPAFWDRLSAWTASARRPVATTERPLQPA